MKNRYGENSVIQAIDNIAEWSFTPTDVINTLEKQCQKTTKKENSDIKKEIRKLLE